MIDKVTRKKREYEMMLINQVRHNLYEKPVLNNLFLEVTSVENPKSDSSISFTVSFILNNPPL